MDGRTTFATLIRACALSIGVMISMWLMGRGESMPNEGQKTVTLSGKYLTLLERCYKKELKTMKYEVSFSRFIAIHALRDLKVRCR